MEEKFTLELLHEVKQSGKRWFIAFLVTLILLFVSNMAWLYAWCLPAEETVTKEYSVESEDNGNAVINESGTVGINGKSDSKDNEKDNETETGQTEGK